MNSTRKFLLASGIIAAIGLGIWLVTSRWPASAPTPGPPASPTARSVPDDFPPLTVAENFTRATTQAERLKWVRQPTRVAAAMAEFFSTGAGAHEVVDKLAPMVPADTGEKIYQRFGVTMADGTQRLLCVVTSAGETKADFKAYSRHGSAPWAELLAGKTKEADEMRVFIRKGNYYNFGFKHEVRWQNFTATSPDLENPVALYMARTHPDLEQLEHLDLQHPTRVTVAIRALDDSHLQRQFEITKFLGAGWVMEN